ncbi:recombinase family protein [bacterium]|jgi:DNA invertase Pin-like site-specific DNA recombinase|nr:recombinase family protein [bacterium]
MKFVAYYRVSTKQQGVSGLGLEAQKEAVTNYITSTGDKLIASFQEVESGTNNDRPELKDALDCAKRKGAKLIVAKLDRLGRKASYILRLIDESGVEFHICDQPDADKLTITILAAVAEREAENTSKRTKAALAVRKAQGVKLGSPKIKAAQKLGAKANVKAKEWRLATVQPIIRDIITKGKVETLKGISEALNARGITTPRNAQWSITQVRRAIGGVKVSEFAKAA